jgi:transcriptional regulator with XRE-family HTH domain
LATRLDKLFDLIRAENGKPFSSSEVADAVRAYLGGTRPTAVYIRQLRTGAQTNPTLKLLEGIAHFFNVPVGYFFDDATAERVQSQLGELSALLAEDTPVGAIFRSVPRLTAQDQQVVAAMVDVLLQRADNTNPPANGDLAGSA